GGPGGRGLPHRRPDVLRRGGAAGSRAPAAGRGVIGWTPRSDRDGGEVTARRQFGAATAACVAGAALVLLALRQGWARVDYTAPRPLPSGSIPVPGQAQTQ